MYSETITLFNRHHSAKGDIWYPHILSKVDLVTDKASVIAKYGAESADSASLHVKYNMEGKDINIQGLKYLPPKEWASQSEELLSSTVTFNDDSNHFDFFINGEYESMDPIVDDDYPEGFYNEIQKSKDYCYVITSVSSPYKLIPHFEIMAK